MSNKRMLIICYPGVGAYCPPLITIEDMGYELEVEYLPSNKKIAEARTFSALAKLCPNLLEYRLEGFDVVIVLVCEPFGVLGVSPFMIPKGIVDELKEKIRQAEVEKSASIRLVGINNLLPDQYLPLHKEIFDGLFIGRDWDSSTFREFLEGSNT